MANVTSSITGKARAVFSDAARVRLSETDEAIVAIDPVTDCTLSYRFEHAGGVLRITNGCLGRDVVAVGCDPDTLNLIATLLLDGLKTGSTSLQDWYEPDDEDFDPSPWSP